MYKGIRVVCDACTADGGDIQTFYVCSLKTGKPQFYWDFIIDVLSDNPYRSCNDLHYCPDCYHSKCHRDARSDSALSRSM